MVTKWYPRRLSPSQIKRKIMREAFLDGYNVKQIASYFRLNLTSVYEAISVKALKVKRLEKQLENRLGNC